MRFLDSHGIPMPFEDACAKHVHRERIRPRPLARETQIASLALFPDGFILLPVQAGLLRLRAHS